MTHELDPLTNIVMGGNAFSILDRIRPPLGADKPIKLGKSAQQTLRILEQREKNIEMKPIYGLSRKADERQRKYQVDQRVAKITAQKPASGFNSPVGSATVKDISK